MATSTLTLYKDNTTSETFNLSSAVGKSTVYDGAGTTPTFPIQMVLTKDQKNVGNMSNDRFYINVHRSGAATGRGQVATSGASLQITVGKDPVSASSLVAEATAALAELVSYITGAAPTSTAMSNIASLVVGNWL